MTAGPTWLAGQTVDAARQQAMAGLVTTFTPSLTTVGAGADPVTSGLGEVKSGVYSQSGFLADVLVHIKFGASASAGSGSYQVQLPVAVDSSKLGSMLRVCIGMGQYIDQSAVIAPCMSCVWISGTNDQVRFMSDSAADFQHNNPHTWAVDDQIMFHLRYPALWV
jgi:hypothetical protein